MNLKNWIKTVGKKEGLWMWWYWEVKSPIQMWYWETFKIRPYCQWAGWHCKDKDCQHIHTSKRPREKEYPIKKGELCVYCGENPATTHTTNPNLDQKPLIWKICETCKQIIPLQEEQSITAYMLMTFPTDKGEQRLKEINQQISDITKETGQESTSVMFMTMEDGKIQAHELGKENATRSNL